jgi:hypothetical protein
VWVVEEKRFEVGFDKLGKVLPYDVITLSSIYSLV